MSEKRIDPAEWDAFARKFSERYGGRDVDVMILDPEMGERYELHEQLLELASEQVEGIDRFDLMTGTPAQPTSYSVPWTRDVWLDSADDGTEEILSIIGENGITTIVRWRERL